MWIAKGYGRTLRLCTCGLAICKEHKVIQLWNLAIGFCHHPTHFLGPEDAVNDLSGDVMTATTSPASQPIAIQRLLIMTAVTRKTTMDSIVSDTSVQLKTWLVTIV